MAEFPVPLDNLITYVKALHPDGGPLENLADAITVADRIEEQSDSLIGHFVDQARRSGASWSQIGASMGVTKQAAQKRFVPRDLIPQGGKLFSRFTPRSRNVLAAAGRIARRAEADRIDETHLAAGLLSKPDGVAAKIIHGTGVDDERFLAAFGLAAAPAGDGGDSDPAALRELRFTDDAKAALSGTLKAALRLGHNYIGTEHLLLGILFAEGAAAQTLASLGFGVELVERALAEEFAKMRKDGTGSA